MTTNNMMQDFYGDYQPSTGFNFGLAPEQSQYGFNNLIPSKSGSAGNTGGGINPNQGWFSRDAIVGGKDKDGNAINGWGSLALGVAKGLGGAYMGMKQYGMAKDTLKENKRQFQLNYDAQKKTINTQREDRQRARVASNADAYESVDSYMNKNRI